MGLDTTHDCFHGSYGTFMRWRITLMQVAYQMDIRQMEGFGGGSISWDTLPDDPLKVLLRHSDCDGYIENKDCLPIANRLEELLPKIEDEYLQEITQRFIKGLHKADGRCQRVGFH